MPPSRALRSLALIAALFVAGPAAGGQRAIAENDLTIDIDGSAASAAAGCQLLVIADLVAIAAALESAVGGLPEASDLERRGTSSASIETSASSHANATCTQPIGTIRLASGASEGWGEPSGPAGGSWGALAPAEDVRVLNNRVAIRLAGDGPAAAVGCQLLIALDAFVMSADVAAPVAGDIQPASFVPQQTDAVEDARADCLQHVDLLEITLSR